MKSLLVQEPVLNGGIPLLCTACTVHCKSPLPDKKILSRPTQDFSERKETALDAGILSGSTQEFSELKANATSERETAKVRFAA